MNNNTWTHWTDWNWLMNWLKLIKLIEIYYAQGHWSDLLQKLLYVVVKEKMICSVSNGVHYIKIFINSLD